MSLKPHTEPVGVTIRVQGRAARSCAACGATRNVSPDPRCGGVLFCASCQRRARQHSPWIDLGRVD